MSKFKSWWEHINGLLAQWLEQQTHNLLISGSSPEGTNTFLGIKMQIKKMSSGFTETLVKLSEVKYGNIIRFPSVTFEEAMSGKDDAQFFMVINKQPAQTARVSLISLDGENIIERDADRQVIIHKAEISISILPN